jgi:transcriptional regulator with XRE-family HTH domain
MPADDFGPSLREERERRGITLEQLSATTRVSVDLWIGLEQNDFSRWPAGIFARAFMRDYARAIGLDSDAVVNEFCRQFPVGDRRVGRIVRAQAELIGHQMEEGGSEPLPAGRERRKARRAESPVPSSRLIYTPRIIAAAVDVGCVTAMALVGTTLLGAGFFAAVGVSALLYFSVSTIGTGATPGVRVLQAVRHRAPSLFTDRRTVSV